MCNSSVTIDIYEQPVHVARGKVDNPYSIAFLN